MIRPTPIPATPPALVVFRLAWLCADRAKRDTAIRRLRRIAPELLKDAKP